MKKRIVLIFTVILVSAFFALVTNSFAFKKRIVFGGGPAGGTFQIVANSIQVYKPVKEIKGYTLKAQTSAGSLENLRKTDSGKQHFSVVYSGHVWQAANGKLKRDTKKYTNTLAVSWLYGAPAQLVIREGSGIRSVKDLIGKKVGVGNAGSGAFANCELFFTHLGVWDKVERNAMGYNDAAAAFGNNQLDAFWLFTAFPSGAVIMAAQTQNIAMLDLNRDAESYQFYEKYPYFERIVIPANTYKGVDYKVNSFQDGALWVSNSKVPADLVYTLLSIIYSEKGLKYMHAQKKTFKSMSIKRGLSGIITPLHPGAEKFWKEKGLLK